MGGVGWVAFVTGQPALAQMIHELACRPAKISLGQSSDWEPFGCLRTRARVAPIVAAEGTVSGYGGGTSAKASGMGRKRPGAIPLVNGLVQRAREAPAKGGRPDEGTATTRHCFPWTGRPRAWDDLMDKQPDGCLGVIGGEGHGTSNWSYAALDLEARRSCLLPCAHSPAGCAGADVCIHGRCFREVGQRDAASRPLSFAGEYRASLGPLPGRVHPVRF
jgi:hypothetical protein